MKVALIHDHLAQDGGAEKVLQVFAGMFPQAPIYTLLYDRNKQDKYYKDRQIEVSVIQKLPGGVKHYQWYLPLMPLAVEFYDLRPYNLVLSDTSSFAKGVITKPDTLHICYCHTPTRFLWSDAHQYINELKYNKWLKKIISLSLSRIRLWDRLAADRVDLFVANSKTVQARIKKYYRRESVVIYPPVETHKFEISYQADKATTEKYFLAGCRLAPYKRIDLIIEAFKELGNDYRLRIFGDGVDLKRLKKLAKGRENIEFLGRVTEEEKIKLFAGAEAFINPQEEDFGITVVESMAAGRPVIALAQGGALETVIPNKTGLFFEEQTTASLVAAIKRFRTEDFVPEEISAWAERFSVANFTQQVRDFIKQHYPQSPDRLA